MEIGSKTLVLYRMPTSPDISESVPDSRLVLVTSVRLSVFKCCIFGLLTIRMKPSKFLFEVR